MPAPDQRNIAAIAPLLVEPWAMPRQQVLSLLAAILAGPDNSSIRTAKTCGFFDDEDDEQQGYTLKNGVATIPIVGPLMKYARWYANSTEEIQATIRRAIADFQVKSIVLVIDCPGGTFMGTNQLGEFIAKVNGTGDGQKPIDAIISDNAHSGGYWVASQCRKIYCNTGGFSGCIGVYNVLLDDTKYWDDLGVSWELISSGGVKGLGADGKITPELRADVQREIDDMFAMFTGAVAQGRGKSIDEARKLGDGRSWIAQQAKELGLIDEVASVDAAMTAIQQELPMNGESFTKFAAEHPDDPAVKIVTDKAYASGLKAGEAKAHQDEIARMTAIEAACPDRSKLAIKQFRAGADVESTKVLVAELDAEATARKGADTKAADALAVANAEIERLKAEAGSRPPIGTAGAAKKKEEEAAAGGQVDKDLKSSNPETVAKAEWAKMSEDEQSVWKDEKTFLTTRVDELKNVAKSAFTGK